MRNRIRIIGYDTSCPSETLEENGLRSYKKWIIYLNAFVCCDIICGLGLLDLNRSHMGSGMSQRNAAKRLISALQRQGKSLQKVRILPK